MTKTFDIYFVDLSQETQEEVLEFYGIESAKEGNFDLYPLFTLENEEEPT